MTDHLRHQDCKSGAQNCRSVLNFRFSLAVLLVFTGGGCQLTTAAELTSAGKAGVFCMTLAAGLERHSPEDPRLYPKWEGPYGDNCSTLSATLKLSVTHENSENTHKGSRNYDSNVVAYMADFDSKKDLGRWLRADIRREGGTSIVSLGLDTLTFDEVNTVTGWPLRFGHLFAGLNDGTVSFSLDRDAAVDFDIRVSTAAVSQASPPAYSGRRVLVGAVAGWNEAPPRTNTAHFLEVDLIMSDGYARAYNEKARRGCDDLDYDRCFFDENGRYAEGREIGLQKILHGPKLTPGPKTWTHIHIPIGATYRALPWISKPNLWASAKVTGVYLGIESVGATDTQVEIKNYHVLDTP
jgi:hypothetical protein